MLGKKRKQSEAKAMFDDLLAKADASLKAAHGQREEILTAFIAKYGYDPEDAEQIIEQGMNEIKYYVRQKAKPSHKISNTLEVGTKATIRIENGRATIDIVDGKLRVSPIGDAEVYVDRMYPAYPTPEWHQMVKEDVAARQSKAGPFLYCVDCGKLRTNREGCTCLSEPAPDPYAKVMVDYTREDFLKEMPVQIQHGMIVYTVKKWYPDSAVPQIVKFAGKCWSAEEIVFDCTRPDGSKFEKEAE